MQPIRETLCLMVAEGYLNQHLNEFKELILPPLYLCTSCGRVAREEALLCLPIKIQSLPFPATHTEEANE